MSSVGISAIEYYLSEKVIDNNFFEHAKNDFLEEKVGIKERRIAREDQATSDLAIEALNKLFTKNNIDKDSIEFLIVCTLSPDYFLPQMSSMIQHRLGLKTSVYALDITLGSSGFVYSLSVAQSLIQGLGFKRGIVVTCDKFSRFLSYKDYTVDTLFSDTACAVLVEKNPKLLAIKKYDFGTDGAGEKHIIIEAGGSKLPHSPATGVFTEVKPGVNQAKDYLYMNGRQVMKFSSSTVPVSAAKVLKAAKITLKDIDWVILHQANKTMLQDIAERMALPAEKNYINLWNKGNTTSSSVPIAIKEVLDNGVRLKKGGYWLISGFGVGFSWGTILLKYVR